MKPFLSRRHPGARGGFSLVEATLSLGVMSFGLLTLAPILVLGMKTARHARNDRATAQIAQAMIEQAKQGTLSTAPAYLDLDGNECKQPVLAAYTAQSSLTPMTENASLTRVTVRVVPIGAPDRARTYAVVIPSTP